jgi:hypothetical protein
MYWNSKDISTFMEQKEFVDTAIVPLLLVDGRASHIKQSAGTADFLMSITAFMENQFKGRVVLMPPITYTKESNRKLMGQEWKEVFLEAGFKHHFFISCDAQWVTEVPELEVIYMPSIPLENMDQKLRQSILDDQIRQVVPIFANYWSKSNE